MKAGIHSVSELEAAIENLLEDLRNRAQADAVTFHYYDETHDRLILPVGVGLVQPRRFKSWVPSMGRVAGKIVKSGVPVVANDAEHHIDTASPFVYVEGVKSAAGFPLITATDEKIGVLFVNYRLPHLFSSEEITILEESVTQIAEIIKGWLAEAPNLKVELSALVGYRREEVALQEITDTIRKVLGDVAVTIWIPKEHRGELVIVAQSGMEEQAVRDARLSLAQTSSIVDAFRTRKLVKGDALEGEPFPKEQANAMRLGTVWAFPLLSQSQALGVLCVYLIGYDDLTPREETIVNAFVEQAAATVENQHKILTLTILNDMGRRLTFTLADPQEVMQEIVASAAWAMRANSVALHQYDPFKREFYTFDKSVAYGIGPYPPTEKPRSDGVSAYIVEHGLISVPDIDRADSKLVGTHQVLEAGVQSYLGIRLKADESVVGVLFFNYNEKREFSPDDLTIAATFANYAATAIHNSQLYRESLQRAQRLDLVRQVAAAVSSTLDLDTILKLAVDGLAQVIGIKQAAVAIFDKAGDYADVRVEYLEPGCVPAMGVRIPLRDSLSIDKILATKRPLIVYDAQNDPILANIKEALMRRQTLSLMIVPIISDDKVVGTIGIDALGQKREFSGEEAELAQVIANQAAAAIKNARQYERMQVLNDMGQVLTSGIRLREEAILALIHSQASRLMDTDNMYIALYDEVTDTVRFGLAFVDGKRADVKMDEFWRPRKAGKGRTEEIIRTKKPILHATKAEVEAWYAQPEHRDYWSGSGIVFPSWLGVPMMVGEKVLGVIAFYHPTQDHVYSGDDLEILQAMANQVAIALDNAYMFYDVDRRRQALVDFGQKVTSGIRLREDEVLGLIHSQAGKLMDTDNMYIALYDEAADVVRFGLAFVDGRRGNVKTEKGWQPRKGGKGRTEEIIRTKHPIFTATKAEAEAWYALPGHEEYVGAVFASWLGVPMMVGGKVLGVIATYHPTQDYAYSGDDLEILQAMANQAAIALYNATLYNQAEKRRSQLEKVREVVKVTTAELEPQACMERMLDEAMALVDARYATIQLVDEASNELVLQVCRGAEGKLPSELRRIKVGRGVTGLAAQEKQTIRLGNVEDVDYYLDLVGEGTRSEMATPLVEHGEVIGVLNVEDPRENAFDQDDEDIFKLLAEHVVVVIQNARRVEASRREQERRAEAQRFEYLGLLAGGVAHRVGSKGGLIRLHVSNLRKLIVPESRDAHAILDKIERDTEYLIELSDALFKPAYAAETPVGPVDVNQLLRKAIRQAAIPSDIQVSFHPGDVPRVNGNKWLVDVFVELITNAMRAMSERAEKRLTICSRRVDENTVAVVCEDTGCGIAPEEQPKLFDLFYTRGRGEETPARGGYGLWYSKSIITRMGGDLRIESEVDKGTKCIVLFPVAKEGGQA